MIDYTQALLIKKHKVNLICTYAQILRVHQGMEGGQNGVHGPAASHVVVGKAYKQGLARIPLLMYWVTTVLVQIRWKVTAITSNVERFHQVSLIMLLKILCR